MYSSAGGTYLIGLGQFLSALNISKAYHIGGKLSSTPFMEHQRRLKSWLQWRRGEIMYLIWLQQKFHLKATQKLLVFLAWPLHHLVDVCETKCSYGFGGNLHVCKKGREVWSPFPKTLSCFHPVWVIGGWPKLVKIGWNLLLCGSETEINAPWRCLDNVLRPSIELGSSAS
jgi:hypothetical protein